jgi:tetratricopeptide (TPR) repeat protein
VKTRRHDDLKRLFPLYLPEQGPSCPDVLTLYHSAAGKLSVTEQRHLDEHMMNCVRCREAELEVRKLLYLERRGGRYNLDRRTGRVVQVPPWAIWFHSLRGLSPRDLSRTFRTRRGLRPAVAAALALLVVFLLWVQARPVLARSPGVLSFARQVPVVRWILPASAREYLQALLLWDRFDQIPTGQEETWRQLGRRIEGHLRRATELDPGYAEPYFWLGELYSTFYYRDPRAADAERFLNMARESYLRTLQINPSHIRARFGLARVYSTLGQFDSELREYNAILQIDPLDTDALWARGWVYLERKEFNRALEDFQAVLRQDPRDWETLWTVGLSRVLAGKFDEAAEAVLELERLNPGRAELLRQIMKVFRTRPAR